ncbi:hypothetical protein JVX92_14900 (plasmid) [Microbacterium hominis]|uniref:hypothetical protein n=1 Tax=Microbacterium hominis TaxID=162426 RepID=UPI001964BA9E|nr:hypothetical protein [Microbacterium hominis]QRY42323.1 hypothetical protein JVX92_14900 [Microbacterium hominis]
MNDEIRVSVSLPLDSDGFLRRECPTCEREFKWFNHDEGDHDAEPASQYFCPLCGEPAAMDQWWTPAQVEYGLSSSGPAIERAIQDAVSDAFKGVKGFTFERDSSFALDVGSPQPLLEPDDMVIVEPPCHPNEPLKVPEDATTRVHCLVCGTPFAV